MNTPRYRRPLLALATILIGSTLTLNACHGFPASLSKPNMTALSARLQPLFKQTKTVCFAQFVIEVPVTATVVFGPAAIDANIDRYAGEAGKLPEYIAERLKKIEKYRQYLDEEFLGTESMYGKVIDGAAPEQKLVIGTSLGFYQVHSYIPVGPDLFVLESHSISSRDNELQKEIGLLNTIASRLRARADTEIPTEPGSCIDGGFVAGPADFENLTLGVRLTEFPDVHFSIKTMKNGQYLSEASDLERRLKRAEEEAKLEGNGGWYARIKFFRRAPRRLGDWNGYEALARKPAQKGASESHQFLYYSLGALHSQLVPVWDIQLDTGVQDNLTASKPPSLTDAEAVALWDKLIGSLHPRPAAPQSGGPIPTDSTQSTQQGE